MTHKSKILKALRKDLLPEPALPSLEQAWIQYEDVNAQFEQAVAAVGGQCHFVDGMNDVQNLLREVPAYRDAKKICSLVEGVAGNVDLAAIEDPHHLEDVDFAVARGHFGVAENGAIWITDKEIKHRVVLFLSQHISLIIPKSELVNNMHEAYARIEHVGGVFGVFISGPSKTADIEQSLVIGAHGARSMNIFVVENV
ncbi:MAG: L-lactate dehydrogenase complex protein LldG [Pirellulaceae bacterium]|jgi:L-lactate dehydrogenase complex protein LldG